MLVTLLSGSVTRVQFTTQIRQVDPMDVQTDQRSVQIKIEQFLTNDLFSDSILYSTYMIVQSYTTTLVFCSGTSIERRIEICDNCEHEYIVNSEVQMFVFSV